jgi:LPPG:FO 2-phospho-L-lactate transferase
VTGSEGASDGRVVALCGGIGGAKLALGLAHEVPPGALSVIVNTGDDFEQLGLHVSPDLDTVLYTLAGLADPERGWGRAGETWAFMGALEALGGETWFRLGDQDLALHVERTRRLRAGEPLSAVTRVLARQLGLGVELLPMSDEPVRTMVETDEGVLAFQDYFVRRRCAPALRAIHFPGAEAARPAPGVVERLADPALRAIVLCPSNPWLSVDPLLAVPGLKAALERAPAPLVAVAPIVAGRAIKGPTAKLMAELGLEISAAIVAAHYGPLLDGYVLDRADAGAVTHISVPTRVADTVMTDLADRRSLARTCLAFADELRPGEGTP